MLFFNISDYFGSGREGTFGIANRKMQKSYSITKKKGLLRGNNLNEKIGACGVYCGFCQAFRLEQNRCFGCEWANRLLRKTRKNQKGCVFFECTQNNDVKCCFQCKEFPCKKHYDSKEAVYTRQALDMWKELGKTGLTFWGKRKELEDDYGAPTR